MWSRKLKVVSTNNNKDQLNNSTDNAFRKHKNWEWQKLTWNKIWITEIKVTFNKMKKNKWHYSAKNLPKNFVCTVVLLVQKLEPIGKSCKGKVENFKNWFWRYVLKVVWLDELQIGISLKRLERVIYCEEKRTLSLTDGRIPVLSLLFMVSIILAKWRRKCQGFNTSVGVYTALKTVVENSNKGEGEVKLGTNTLFADRL